MKTITYKAEDFVPVMACPSQVDKIRDVSELEGTEIDQVFIGSVQTDVWKTSELQQKFLKGKKVADYVKLIVTPAAARFIDRQWHAGYTGYSGRSRCDDHTSRMRTVLWKSRRYPFRWRTCCSNEQPKLPWTYGNILK